MPVSSPLGKDIIKGWFGTQKDILKIVDVGCGEGTYKKLLGDKYYWIGVEIWKDYIKKYNLKSLYNEIIEGDIREIPLPDADCIIFGDVIEHLPRIDALKLLGQSVEKYKHLVLSIPIGKYEQGAIEGNPNEEHKATWYFDDLAAIIQPVFATIIPYCPTCPKNMGIGIFVK